ncbi:MAG: twin-arginine translocase TatA/TatE family subunit [Chloroflexota bacterium]|nr:MAG: twin-arginine translocase TatA/TatE family subunit [Chloroflexota bacterium]
MSLGPIEFGIIALLVVIVLGVGKLGSVGGALGKSVKEFRQELGGTEELGEDSRRASDG